FLLLLHGGAFGLDGVCSNVFAWELILPGLAAHYRVIAPELAGQGRTGCGHLSAESLVSHAKAVVEHFGIKRFHVVGHDEGALVAFQLAFDLPQRVLSCLIAGGPAITPSSESVPNELLSFPPAEAFSAERQHWIAARKSAQPLHLAQGRYFAEAVEIGQSEGIAALRERLSGQGGLAALRKSFLAMKSRTFGRFHQGFPVPCLLIWGLEDRLTPWAHARTLFDLIAARQPHTEMRLINGSGNLTFRESPAAFNAAAIAFMDAIEAQERARPGAGHPEIGVHS
ncbi:MAG: alpha/beta hydrolase, partial [Microbacterium sp.]